MPFRFQFRKKEYDTDRSAVRHGSTSLRFGTAPSPAIFSTAIAPVLCCDEERCRVAYTDNGTA